MGERVITVLLTRYHSLFSNFVYYASGREYTHASIALDEKNEYYYSFNYKGFRKEYPRKHVQRSGKSICYKLGVSEEGYALLQHKLEEMQKNIENLHYSRLGVFCCLAHIPFHRKNHYFCSQFVAEMLMLSGAAKLQRETSLYTPNRLLYELGRQSSLREILCNPI